MHHVLFSPMARSQAGSQADGADLAPQLPQALVASLRPGISASDVPAGSGRGNPAAAPTRVGDADVGPASRRPVHRSAGLGLRLEAIRFGLDLSDWTGARLFLAGLGREHDASLVLL
ncbi:hypothetical protein [Sphingobium arseniciresistens]|uniref:hypothetical protein n=1 Tax=Sphingobium arseniciresistens TaxID=3030834 RepID=UPI0023B8A81D